MSISVFIVSSNILSFLEAFLELFLQICDLKQSFLFLFLLNMTSYFEHKGYHGVCDMCIPKPC